MIKKIKNSSGINIYYKHYKYNSKIGVLFCSGLNSDMKGNKANKIFNWCKINNIECVLFDYSGHGKSSGDFKNFGIEDWISDANLMLNKVIKKPTIIVGSSMGSWIALNIGIKNSPKVIGIIGIASAPDFTETLWKNIF